MNTLPQVQPLVQTFEGFINGEQQILVNARELHAFLESQQDFSTWITKRITKYDFVENQDFIRFHKKMEANNATLIEYHLTLDMAKELSMVERNEKGRMARRYFIDCEKALHQLTTTDPLASIAHNMQVLANATQATMARLDHTERYINLLELNQKGTIKVTPEVIEQVKLMKQQGYSQANIGRMLRISATTVNLIVNDKYPMNKMTSDEHITRMIATAKTVLEQGE